MRRLRGTSVLLKASPQARGSDWQLQWAHREVLIDITGHRQLGFLVIRSS